MNWYSRLHFSFVLNLEFSNVIAIHVTFKSVSLPCINCKLLHSRPVHWSFQVNVPYWITAFCHKSSVLIYYRCQSDNYQEYKWILKDLYDSSRCRSMNWPSFPIIWCQYMDFPMEVDLVGLQRDWKALELKQQMFSLVSAFI